jgi:hypothetical protein
MTIESINKTIEPQKNIATAIVPKVQTIDDLHVFLKIMCMPFGILCRY